MRRTVPVIPLVPVPVIPVVPVPVVPLIPEAPVLPVPFAPADPLEMLVTRCFPVLSVIDITVTASPGFGPRPLRTSWWSGA